MKTITDGKHTFEIVESVPLGYEIWNIGKNMLDGYLPLCRLKAVQAIEGGQAIETDTLKAIKVEDAQIILRAIGGGQNTIKSMEIYIKRYKNAKPGTRSYMQVKRIEKALPIMRTIKWD